MTPRWPLTLFLFKSVVQHYPMINMSKSYGNTLKYVDTIEYFCQNFNQNQQCPGGALGAEGPTNYKKIG